MADSFDRADAIKRARAEIDLELNRWKDRLKASAIAKTQLALEVEGVDPVEAGRAAALEALNDGFFSDGEATKALSSGS
jgi:hypothetical protein